MKIGSRVQIKSFEWYKNQKLDSYSGFNSIKNNNLYFNPRMSKYCGKIYTIKSKVFENNQKIYILEGVYDDRIDSLDLSLTSIHSANYHWKWSKDMLINIQKIRKEKLKKLKDV